MSSTVYGGKTVNGVFVEDMVDNNKDYVYYLDEQQTYFVRLSEAKIDENEKTKPAFVLFNSSRPFDVLYGKILDKEYSRYVDEFGRDTKLFDFELDKFKAEVYNHFDEVKEYEQKELESCLELD